MKGVPVLAPLGGFGELRIPHQPFMPPGASRATRHHHFAGSDAKKGLQFPLNTCVDVFSRPRAGEDQAFHNVSPDWDGPSLNASRRY
jgi:hypothetical protein